MTIKGMECASLMPIDLFFEAPRLMDSCNFTDDHTWLTRDVRWYDGTMVQCSTLLYIRTMEANIILLYSRRTEICDPVSVVKPNKAAVAFNNAELY